VDKEEWNIHAREHYLTMKRIMCWYIWQHGGQEKHHAKWMKTDTKGQIVCELILIKYPE
jgi:hypothetical protein